MPSNQSNYLRIRIGSNNYALCLVPNGSGNPGMGGIPHVHRGGVTYDVYLVNTNEAFASPARMKTSGGTKAVRYYTEYTNTAHGDVPHTDNSPHSDGPHTNQYYDIPHTNLTYHADDAHSDFTYGDFSNYPHSDIPHQNSAGHSDTPHSDEHSDQTNHTDYRDFGGYTDVDFGEYTDYYDYANTAHNDIAHSDYGVGHTDQTSHTDYRDFGGYTDVDFGEYTDFTNHTNVSGGQHADSPHSDVAHSNAGTYHNHEDSLIYDRYYYEDYWGTPHSDVPYTNNPNAHGDGGYSDHSDVHSNFSDHSNITHQDTNHVDSEFAPTFN